MRYWSFFLCLWISSATVAVFGQPQALPQELRAGLTAGQPAVLHSVSPRKRESREVFMGYPSLGRVEVKGEEAQALGTAVLQGLTEAKASDMEDCFAPRHGLTFSGGKLLICYACHRVLYESASGVRHSFAISHGGQLELAQAVYDHGLLWQSWQPVGRVMRHSSGLAVPVPKGFTAAGSAASETLSLKSSQESVQSSRLPGFLVLKSDNGKEEVVSTKWLDHSRTEGLIWYSVGLPSRYEKSLNRRTVEGSDYELAQIRAHLDKADQPARRVALVRMEPLADRGALRRTLSDLAAEGYRLSDVIIEGNAFRAGELKRDGLKIWAAAGLVETATGTVLVSARIPEGIANPLPTLLQIWSPEKESSKEEAIDRR